MSVLLQHEINFVPAIKQAAKRATRVADQITPYTADQAFCLKLSHTLIFFLNILQSSYIAIMSLRAVFSMFALQMIFFHVYHLKDGIQLILRQIP